MHFADTLGKVRQTLSTPKLMQEESNKNLSDILSTFIMNLVEKIKGVLRDLVVFIQADINFAQNTQFKDSFCVDNVREGLIVCFFHHMTATARGHCSSGIHDSKIPPSLFLLLSKLCLEFQNGSVHFIVRIFLSY